MSMFKKLKSKHVLVDTKEEARKRMDAEREMKKHKELMTFEKYRDVIEVGIVKLLGLDEVVSHDGLVKVASSRNIQDYKFTANETKSFEQNLRDAFPLCHEEIADFMERLNDEEITIIVKYNHDGGGISSWADFFINMNS